MRRKSLKSQQRLQLLARRLYLDLLVYFCIDTTGTASGTIWRLGRNNFGNGTAKYFLRERGGNMLGEEFIWKRGKSLYEHHALFPIILFSLLFGSIIEFFYLAAFFVSLLNAVKNEYCLSLLYSKGESNFSSPF